MPLFLVAILVVVALFVGAGSSTILNTWRARQEGGARKQLAQAKATLNKLGVHVD